MKTWEAAVQVLRETDNPAVMWGDEGLLHQIANRAGIGSTGRFARGHVRSSAVLDNLARSPGILVAKQTYVHITGRKRWVRIFYLPEHAT